MLMSIKWYHFVQNDDVWRQTKQPKLTAIIRACRLTIFGHIARMDDNADAKRILRRPPGRPRITRLSTIQYDLRCHNLTLPEAVDIDKNRPLWRLLSMSGAKQSQSYMPETTTTTNANRWWSHEAIIFLDLKCTSPQNLIDSSLFQDLPS